MIYSGIKQVLQQQVDMLEELTYLRRSDVESNKVLNSHSKALDVLQKGIDSTAQAAGDNDIYMRDLQEQLATATANIQKSVDESYAALFKRIDVISEKEKGGEEKAT